MLPIEIGRFALLWGPGVLVLMVFSYALLRLAQYWIAKSMDFKQKQLDSLLTLGRTYFEQFVATQRSQADAFSRLASAVEQRDSHESFEHQEMLIALKAIRERLTGSDRDPPETSRQHAEREERSW